MVLALQTGNAVCGTKRFIELIKNAHESFSFEEPLTVDLVGGGAKAAMDAAFTPASGSFGAPAFQGVKPTFAACRAAGFDVGLNMCNSHRCGGFSWRRARHSRHAYLRHQAVTSCRADSSARSIKRRPELVPVPNRLRLIVLVAASSVRCALGLDSTCVTALRPR